MNARGAEDPMLRLSAIVLAPEGYPHVRQTLRHLAAQSIAGQMEVVFVAPTLESLHPVKEELTAFATWQVVEFGNLCSVASGYAAGVRAARAPIVVFTEDHCYPAPGWAEALVAAHDGGCSVAGPVIAIANPDGAVAWAIFLIEYGPWLDPSPGGDMDFLPGHNSSYRREVLLAYEPDLERWLEAECVLHWDLRRRGHGLRLEPAARTHHFNYSRLAAALDGSFHSSRLFAARRVRGAGPLRRAAYAAASPLIPPLRLGRCLRHLARCRERPRILRLLPPLGLTLLFSAAGEAAGYALGPGSAARNLWRYEYRRDRYLTVRDRQRLASACFWTPGPHPARLPGSRPRA